MPSSGVQDIDVLFRVNLIAHCMRMTQDQSAVDVENRFEVGAELADIAWSPNLNVSGFDSQSGRALLTIDPGSMMG